MPSDDKSRVLVFMSGGIDSSSSVKLLIDSGYDVTGMTARFYDNESHIDKATKVAHYFGINHFVLDLREEFRALVIADFSKNYGLLKTPNPCITCNHSVKFGLLFEEALRRGYDYIATGHYAVVKKQGMGYALFKSPDISKDQSYFLYILDQRILKRTLFPLAGYEKDKIKTFVKKYGIPVRTDSESQDICFIDTNYKDFLERECGFVASPGPIYFQDKLVGEHQGLYRYTIGQRRGIGVAMGDPVYVTGFDVERNALMIGTDSDLKNKGFYMKDFHFVSDHYKTLLFDTVLSVKVRYRTGEKRCRIEKNALGYKVTLLDFERGITPGQHAVFFRGREVLGGGVIEKKF